MKLFSKWMLLFSFLAFLILGVPSFAEMPQEGGGAAGAHGGNAQILEFKAIGEFLVQLLYDPIETDFPEVDPAKFRDVVQSTEIRAARRRLHLNGREVIAINYPSRGLIRFSVKGWRELGDNSNVKLSLVFHEYLGILGIERDVYTVSSRLEAVLRRQEFYRPFGRTKMSPPKFRCNFERRSSLGSIDVISAYVSMPSQLDFDLGSRGNVPNWNSVSGDYEEAFRLKEKSELIGDYRIRIHASDGLKCADVKLLGEAPDVVLDRTLFCTDSTSDRMNGFRLLIPTHSLPVRMDCFVVSSGGF